MMHGNTLQSSGYQPVKQNNCVQTAQCKMPQLRVGHHLFSHHRFITKVVLKHTCFKHTSVNKDGTGMLTEIIHVHIENCRVHSLKFKPEQYSNQLKVMQLYFQPHMNVVFHCSRNDVCLVSGTMCTGSLDR